MSRLLVRKRHVLAATKSSPSGPFGGLVSTANLVSYWKLDNLVDSFGTNNLTNNGGATFVPGKVANGANFTGTQYLSCLDNASLRMAGTSFTISYWINPNAGDVYTVGKDSSDGAEYQLGLFGGLNPGFVTGTSPISSGILISTGVWTFIIAWYDLVAGTKNIQVNNGTIASSASTGPTNLNNSFNIGGINNIPYVNGKIDEIGIWKRVLTPTERTALYNSGNGLTF